MKKLSILTLALLCATSLALAQKPGKEPRGMDERGPRMEHGAPGPHQERKGGPDFDYLELTDTQKKQLADHREKNAETHIDLRANLQKAELRLRKALESQPVDEAGLKAAREDLIRYQTQQIDFRITHMRFFLSVLTPEQRARFESSMDESKPGKWYKKGKKQE